MLPLVLRLALAASPLPEVLPSPDPLPRLDYAQTVYCAELAPSRKVPSGRYRVQCSAQGCLAAPNAVLLDGVESQEELARVAACDFNRGELQAQLEAHPQVFEAVAEAPPGWYRDERGRVMQVNFDLSRRVYFGGSWAPFIGEGRTGLGRGRAELGVSITWDTNDGDLQHRLHFVETEVWMGTDVRYDLSVARYDGSARRKTALLWLSTFVGQPRRHDLDLNLSWAADVLHFEGLGGRNYLTIAEVDAVVDLWHSRDLDSYLRLRFGPAAEASLNGGGVYFRPTEALELNTTLDRDGFHHLVGSVETHQLIGGAVLPDVPRYPVRLKGRFGYEGILLAINDYPLTLVTDVRAVWRDDVPTLPGWEFQANVGLRFSFWAPARRTATAVAVARR